jgi:hypothetical protein
MGGCKSNPGYLAVENQTSRMPNENQSPNEPSPGRVRSRNDIREI